MNEMQALDSMEAYEAALKEIEHYFQIIPIVGTEAAERFDFLSARIKEFEDIHFPIGGNDRPHL